jgi:hypothetical protein
VVRDVVGDGRLDELDLGDCDGRGRGGLLVGAEQAIRAFTPPRDMTAANPARTSHLMATNGLIASVVSGTLYFRQPLTDG